jgi:hypothetical protein
MRNKKRIPQFKSYEEMGEFWDTHSLADYWDQTEPAKFEISEQMRHRYDEKKKKRDKGTHGPLQKGRVRGDFCEALS